MTLNDPELRTALIQYLLRLAVAPRKIIEELHVHFGQAIADVVAIYKEAHCYEIKGDNDSISRLKTQGAIYNTVFRKTTLVTTKKHITNALKTTPSHWGILIVEYRNGYPIIRSLRKALASPQFNKENAVHTLWRNEMIEIVTKHNIDVSKKIDKRGLAETIAISLPVSVISKDIAYLLLKRTESIAF